MKPLRKGDSLFDTTRSGEKATEAHTSTVAISRKQINDITPTAASAGESSGNHAFETFPHRPVG